MADAPDACRRADIQPINADVQPYAQWLWALTALFAIRIISQPLALVVDFRWLPRFESWHSGVMPYPLLVVAQLFILAWLAIIARRVSHNTVKPNRTSGRFLIAIAAVYAATMGTRLVPGATVLRDDRWFGSPVPTLFHLGLAGYLFVFGHLHARHG